MPSKITATLSGLAATPNQWYIEMRSSADLAGILDYVAEHGLILHPPWWVERLQWPSAMDGWLETWLAAQDRPERIWLWAQSPRSTSAEELCANAIVFLVSPVFHRVALPASATAFSYGNVITVQLEEAETDISAVTAALRATDTTPVEPQGDLRRLTLDWRPGLDAMSLAHQAMASFQEVASAWPDWIQLTSYLAEPTNDPHYSGLAPDQWNLQRINVDAGWSVTQGNPAIQVAIIDTGSHHLHPDLVGRFNLPGFDVVTLGANADDWDGHGTAVAGISGAATDNNLFIAGIARACPLRAIRLPVYQGISDWYLTTGIDKARSLGARVVNLSIVCNQPQPAASFRAIRRASACGMVLVAATGNDKSIPGQVSYPASHPEVIAVGATTQLDQRWSAATAESQFGAALSVMAPGTDIWSTLYGPPKLGVGSSIGDSQFGGTSFAAPHVSGLAALILSAHPSLSSAAVRDIIERTAAKVGGYAYTNSWNRPNGTWNVEMGYGRIRVGAAMSLAATYCS